MTSEIRVNKLQNRVGLGTVEFTNTGVVVSGIVTATELSGLTALNIAGVGTANTLDINGDIDVDGHTNLDNVSIAGIVTATTIKGNGDGMSGIHTVATNPSVTPSNSLLAIGNAGSYRFIQSHGGQELRINSVGNDVKLPATRTYIGSNPAANITNNANSRVITGGSNGVINGEANLTFTGQTLTAHMSTADPAVFVGDSNRTGAGQHLAEFRGYWDGNHIARIVYAAGDDTTNKDDGIITMHTTPSGGGITERLRIKSDGGILQTKTGGNANYTISRNESVGTTDQTIGVIDFASNTAHTVQARVMGKTLGTSNVGGDLVVETRANGGSLDERFRITGGGNVNIGGDYTQTSYLTSITNTANTNLFRIKTANEGDYDLRFNIQNGESHMWHYGTDDFVIGNRYSRKLHLITNAQKRLTVHGDFIGINETTPDTYVHVKGTGRLLRLETTASGGGQCYIDFNDETATRASIGMRGSSSDTLTVGAYNAGLRFDVQNQNQTFTINNNGGLQHEAATGISYFKGSSEYIIGSQYSSPSSGGAEAKFQVHDYKTRATMSLNAYMNNAGAPFLQFVSSRSGTPGVLGTKAAINDYHGDIRFMGDNGTNYQTLVQSGQILVRQKSTISDGDTVCEGEMSFYTGNATGGAIQSKLQITGSGKIKYGLHDSSMPHAVQARGFVLYPNNGSNNKTTIRVSGLVSGCFIFQMGYYNSAGQGEGGFACAVSGYMTSTNQYTIDNIKAPYAHANSSISGINKQNSYFEFTITNNHGSYTGGGTIGIIGDQEMTITVTYHS